MAPRWRWRRLIRYYLGRPKFDRIVINFATDENAADAQILAGDVDVGWTGTWTPDSMAEVRSRGLGDFVVDHENYSHIVFQFRDLAVPSALAHDARLRQALDYATDREALDQATQDDLGPIADSWIPPDDPRYAAAMPYIQQYPYDPQRAQALFADAGWIKGSDGLLHDSAGGTFPCVVRGVTGGATVGTVVANSWRAVGVDTSVEVLPSELTRDLAVRASYTCVETSSRALGRMSFQHLESNNAMLPENNYSGTDHGSYMNPQLDVALNGLFAALTVDDRAAARARSAADHHDGGAADPYLYQHQYLLREERSEWSPAEDRA